MPSISTRGRRQKSKTGNVGGGNDIAVTEVDAVACPRLLGRTVDVDDIIGQRGLRDPERGRQQQMRGQQRKAQAERQNRIISGSQLTKG